MLQMLLRRNGFLHFINKRYDICERFPGYRSDRGYITLIGTPWDTHSSNSSRSLNINYGILVVDIFLMLLQFSLVVGLGLMAVITVIDVWTYQVLFDYYEQSVSRKRVELGWIFLWTFGSAVFLADSCRWIYISYKSLPKIFRNRMVKF